MVGIEEYRPVVGFEGLYEGAHNNGDPFDNSLENLAWKTTKANSDDAFRHGARRLGPRGFERVYA